MIACWQCDSLWFGFKQAQIQIAGYSDFSFFFYLLTFEADEETEDHVIAGGEGGGDVEVESEAEAKGEPEGQAEDSISHVSEALPDVPHKPSGAHQEGVQM